MKIEVGKFKADIPLVVVVVLAMVADNIYINYCKKKAFKEQLKANKKYENKK